MTFDQNLRSLDIGMHENHYDRYKLIALYKKTFGHSPKRGTPVEDIVSALVAAR